MEGRVRMCIRSSYVLTRCTDAAHYAVSGETFNLVDVTAQQVYVFPDDVDVAEGDVLTEGLLVAYTAEQNHLDRRN